MISRALTNSWSGACLDGLGSDVEPAPLRQPRSSDNAGVKLHPVVTGLFPARGDPQPDATYCFAELRL